MKWFNKFFFIPEYTEKQYISSGLDLSQLVYNLQEEVYEKPVSAVLKNQLEKVAQLEREYAFSSREQTQLYQGIDFFGLTEQKNRPLTTIDIHYYLHKKTPVISFGHFPTKCILHELERETPVKRLPTHLRII